MAQLHIWPGKHIGIHVWKTVQLNGWATSMDIITMQFKDGVAGGVCLSKTRWTSNHVTTQSMQTVNKQFRITRTKIRVNLMMKSTCWMTIPIQMWPTEFRTNWMPCFDGRCSNILHIAHNNYHTIFMSLNLQSPQRLQRNPSKAIHSCGMMTTTMMMMMMMCGKLWCSGLRNSPRNSLQMGYTDLCISETCLYAYGYFFLNVPIPTLMSILEEVSDVHASYVGFL
jgi:hypothetical protein